MHLARFNHFHNVGNSGKLWGNQLVYRGYVTEDREAFYIPYEWYPGDLVILIDSAEGQSYVPTNRYPDGWVLAHTASYGTPQFTRLTVSYKIITFSDYDVPWFGLDGQTTNKIALAFHDNWSLVDRELNAIQKGDFIHLPFSKIADDQYSDYHYAAIYPGSSYAQPNIIMSAWRNNPVGDLFYFNFEDENGDTSGHIGEKIIFNNLGVRFFINQKKFHAVFDSLLYPATPSKMALSTLVYTWVNAR